MPSSIIQHHFSVTLSSTLTRPWEETGFMVGEYWRADAKVLSRYIEYMNNRISSFDVPLVQNFSKISRQQVRPDIRRVFDGSLAAIKPANAVVSSSSNPLPLSHLDYERKNNLPNRLLL